MTTLTLLAKVSSNSQLAKVSKTLKIAFEGLDAEAKVLGTVGDGWVQIDLAGEDHEIAMNYLIKEIGLCPSNFENLKKFSILKGYITRLGKRAQEISVDVGVFQPTIVQANISLRNLQAQLVDGRKVALKKIVELYGFCEGLPVSVEVTSLDETENRIEAEFSSRQLGDYLGWRESLLDRLMVLGTTFQEIKRTIKHAKLERDIIEVEPLGLLDQVLTCKLGTDAAGVIPKLGRTLKHAKFAVFNPKRLRQFLA